MTQEEIAQLKAMTKSERFSKYTPMLMDKKITQKQYEFILSIPCEVVRAEAPVLSQENTNTHEQEAIREDVQRLRHTLPSAQEEQIATLAQQFGGYVLPVAPERERNEDRAQDTLWEHRGATNHEDKHKGLSQKARLLKLLSDGQWHSTIEIQRVVYGGSHLGVARIASRANDLRKEGHEIKCRKKEGTIYEYKKELSQISKNIMSG